MTNDYTIGKDMAAMEQKVYVLEQRLYQIEQYLSKENNSDEQKEKAKR